MNRTSLSGLSNCLGLYPTNLAQEYLKQKDRKRLAESQYKNTERAKNPRQLARRKCKGLDDKHQQKERVVGAFDAGDTDPGPSKRQKNDP